MNGKEFKQKRDSLGLSQEKLARLLDVSVSTVARWEQSPDQDIRNSKMLTFSLDAIAAEISKNKKP